MKIQLMHQQAAYQCNLAEPLDLSIPVGQVKCFYAKDFVAEPYVSGDFVGSVKAGASINFYEIQMNPHGHGTHTECLGHITEQQESIQEQLKQFHFIAQLISVPLTQKPDGDQLISKAALLAACPEPLPEALIIRTLPNSNRKLTADYSGSNPPYLEAGIMDYLVYQKVKHLLLDLPSVDKESDGGKLLNHRRFWNVEGHQAIDDSRKDCTITELIFVPDEIKDGLYLLNIQIPSIRLDAAPSKPVLYKMSKRN